jgi:hypothetical protein
MIGSLQSYRLCSSSSVCCLPSPPVPSPTPWTVDSELTSNDFWKTVGSSPTDHSLSTRISCPLSELQCHLCSTSVSLLFFTDCILSPSTTLGFLETSYDDTYEATSRSRTRSLSLYSLEVVPLGLSPFSRHRSLKKHLDSSLVYSSTSSSRAEVGPRVCPFCHVVVVPSQVLILLAFRKENKKSIKQKEWPPH